MLNLLRLLPLIGSLVVVLASPPAAATRIAIDILGEFSLRSLTITAPAGATLQVNGQPVPGPATWRLTHTGLQGPGSDHRPVRLATRQADGSPGALVVTLPDHTTRTYDGTFDLEPAAGRLLVINRLDLEDYVAGVVGAELWGTVPREAARAQAVLARTYALRSRGRHGRPDIDLCDRTHCQVYRGRPRQRWARAAARSTAGEAVLWQGKTAVVFYHSTCGGHTADVAAIWPDQSRPYLRGVPDGPEAAPACAASRHHHWNLWVPREQLARKLAPLLGLPPASGPREIRVLARDAGGWATRVLLPDIGRELSGHAFRMMMSRAFGYRLFRSAHFRVHAEGRTLVFEGEGLGHGVGLCQQGAMERARRGAGYRQILQHYFPGTTVGRPGGS